MNESELLRIKQRFGIIGNSSLLNHALEVAMQVAPTDMTVLISGESGSGKESFSKIVHQLSARKHGRFIAVNCGAIPEGTIDSELFGHEKGSFTGAIDARKGYFEVTNKGTIFLDEIAELPLNTQARLLRVLEVGEFIKVGSSNVLKTDVRVVAASNVSLEEAVQKGKFREDLYYRLSTVPIFVPPLRDRGTDLELIFRKFAGDFSEKYKSKSLKLTPEAIEVLHSYHFPGNIRQLKNIVEQMSVLEFEKLIQPDIMRKYIPSTKASHPVLYKGNTENERISERDLLYKVLFDLKNDVTELKKLVSDIIENDGEIHQNLVSEHKQLLTTDTAHQIKEPPKVVKPTTTPYVIDVASTPPVSTHYEQAEKVQDISHELEEDDSLSIEKKEKELIIKALRKNNNKRKYAAQDLGISERTLYRKIKHYHV